MDGLTGLHVSNLLADRRGAAFGVGGDADEPADARLQDLLGHKDTFGGGGDEIEFLPETISWLSKLVQLDLSVRVLLACVHARA